MTRIELLEQIKLKKSLLCVGLDPVLEKIPSHLLDYDNPILEFNKRIIDATKDHCIAYKPNVAFYECLGSKGWDILKATEAYIPKNIFKIADAKRGDIGNTSKMYAKAFFEEMDFDSITVAPYMGEDSISPFLEYENKWVILLGLTSNFGSNDFQRKKMASSMELFELVLQRSQNWGNPDNLMYVVGATHPRIFKRIRKIIPEHFILVPGIGAQGGDLKGVLQNGLNENLGLLINSARSIIYAGQDENFEDKVKSAAQKLHGTFQKLF